MSSYRYVIDLNEAFSGSLLFYVLIIFQKEKMRNSKKTANFERFGEFYSTKIKIFLDSNE